MDINFATISNLIFRGETHKNDVLLFCRKKARECHENVSMTDRESAVLLWNFLELLIKQNGVRDRIFPIMVAVLSVICV